MIAARMQLVLRFGSRQGTRHSKVRVDVLGVTSDVLWYSGREPSLKDKIKWAGKVGSHMAGEAGQHATPQPRSLEPSARYLYCSYVSNQQTRTPQCAGR
jgi:hypothetical protein